VKSRVIRGGDEGVEVFVTSTVMAGVAEAREDGGWEASAGGGTVEIEGNWRGVEEGGIVGVAKVDWQAIVITKTRISVLNKWDESLL
jgi:hypothetical protein